MSPDVPLPAPDRRDKSADVKWNAAYIKPAIIATFFAAAGASGGAQMKHLADLRDFDRDWDYSDPAGTRDRFFGHLKGAGEPADSEWTLQLKTQIARTYGLERQFEEAHRLLDQVEQGLTKITPIARVRYLLERGRCHNSSGSRTDAFALFESGYREALAGGLEYHAVDAAHMAAIAASNSTDRRHWTEVGIEQANASTHPRVRRWLGPLNNNLGWELHESGEYASALSAFERALDAFTRHGDPHEIFIARWTVARALRSLDRLEAALRIQQELEQEMEGRPAPDGFVYEELAELHERRGAHETASRYFGKAFEVLSRDSWLVKNEPQRLERLRNLAER